MSKIVKIEKINYRGWVYGIDIEEDKSFVANGIVVHNCERGMNQGSNFSLIKSIDSTPSLDSILSSFQDKLSPFSDAQIYVENSGEIPSVIIKADKYNSIIDMLILELQKMLPENTPVVVKYDVSDAIPVYKMQLVPIWTIPQTEREADHSFPAKLEGDIIVKESKTYKEETEEINDSKKTEKAQSQHKFIAAEWTHKNGHPRCKICGMEEGLTKICPGMDKENSFSKNAEQGTPPRPGLVPKSGDPRHPDRWIAQKNVYEMQIAAYIKESKIFRSKLSDDENKSIDVYVEKNARRLNRALRKGDSSNKLMQKQISLLDAAINKSKPLHYPMKIYRGITKNLHLNVGTKFTDKGFVSTCIGKEGAKEFQLGYNNSAFFEIILPAGSKVGFLGIPNQTWEPEYEVLLPRNSIFQVEDINSKNNTTILRWLGAENE